MTKKNKLWRPIIRLLIGVGAGVGMYFFIRSSLISSGQENLMPFVTIALLAALPVGWLIIRFEAKLMSLTPIKSVVIFFKRTQYLWFTLMVGGIIAMYWVNKVL